MLTEYTLQPIYMIGHRQSQNIEQRKVIRRNKSEILKFLSKISLFNYIFHTSSELQAPAYMSRAHMLHSGTCSSMGIGKN